jgi:hypothetical protein
MIFKWSIGLLPIMITLTVLCSTDPVNVDTSRLPPESKSFKYNGLDFMLADSGGGYCADSYYGLYRIAPDSPDVNGNIVLYIGFPGLWIYSLFYDDFGRKSIITSKGIYSLGKDYDTTFQAGLNTYYSLDKRYLSIDWKGQCWYLLQSSSNRYQVYRYAKGSTRLCTDSYAMMGDLLGMKFAAADDRFVVSYGTFPWETWLNLFRQDTLERVIHLFSDTDSTYISCLCFIGNEVQITAECFKSVFSYTSDLSCGNGGTIYPGINILRIDQNGRISNRFQGSSHQSFYYGCHCFYRSSRETWLWDSTAYCIVTPDTLVQHDFREGYINRFSVPCFKDSSEVQFFDEVTQRFIKIN